MSFAHLSFQQLLELQTERHGVLLKFCNKVATTRLTPEQERALKPHVDAATAALAEVNAVVADHRAAMQPRF